MVSLTGYTGSQNPVLSLGSLDFADIRNSLIEYLKQNSTFKDYDFRGSALSTLIDLLTYNSSLYSFYANMIANESFLDTAVKRESINSLIKPLSYTPTSRRSPQAEVIVTGTGQTIRFGDLFTGGGYQWTPNDRYYVDGSTQITLVQGNRIDLVSENLVDRSTRHQRFKIPNSEIDTTTLKVYVDEGKGYSQWKNAENVVGNISGFTAGSTIYFLAPSNSGGYEIYFGDNVLGKLPEHQSQIKFEYLITSGSEGNGVSTFSSQVSNVGVVNTKSIASGGGDVETLESIKEKAPLMFQTQGRAVTARDYKVLLENKLGSGVQVNFWGGEDNDPPQYGRVFVSAISNEKTLLGEGQVQEIINFSNEKSIVSVNPKFIDPIVIDLRLSGIVLMDANVSYRSEDEILDLIQTYTTNYPLSYFDDSFKVSDYISGLIDLDSGIVGENIQLYISRTYTASETDRVVSLTIPFLNAILNPDGQDRTSLKSLNSFRVKRDGIVYTVDLYDDGEGNIDLWDTINDNKIAVVGSVNYRTGNVQINDLGAIEDFTIQVIPRYNLITSKRNIVLSIASPEISVEREN